jgi:hypothetical protein
MLYFQSELDFWHEIQQNCIKERHWIEICKIMKTDIIHNRSITIRDVMSLPVKLYSGEIRQVILKAKKENKYEKLLEKIKYDIENTKLKVITYKTYHILSEFDLSSEQLEDNLISIENALNNAESIPYKDDLKDWKKKLSLMQNTIDKLLEIQKTWLALEPTFKNSSLKN